MAAKSWLLLASGILLGVSAWLHFNPDSDRVQPLASCDLLRTDTVQASFKPPASLAEFDSMLALMESKAEAHAVIGRFRQEAATRRLQRFQALRQLDDLAAAERHNAALLHAHPNDRLALARQAALKIAQHDFRAAKQYAQQAEASFLEHDALEELGEFERAAALLTSQPSAGLSYHVRQARYADSQGDTALAFDQLQQAIDDSRRSSTHPLILAGLLAQQSTLALHNAHYQQACEGYREVLQLNPQHVASLVWLGRWAWHADQPQLARDFLTRAMQLDRFSVEVPLLLAQMQTELEQRDALLSQARARAQNWPQWYRLNSAIDLAQQGQAQQALDLLAEEAKQRLGREYWAAVLQISTRLNRPQQAQRALQQLQAHGVLHPPLAMLAWEFWQTQGQPEHAAAYSATLQQGRVELSPDQWRHFLASQSAQQNNS